MSENPQQPQSPQQPSPGQPPYQGQPHQPYQSQPQGGQPQPGPPHSAGYGPGAPYQPQPLNPSDERMWSVFAQIGPVLLTFIPPLVIWLSLKDRSRFVDQEAKEALNFQITLVLVHIVCLIITTVTFGLGSIVYLVFVAALVFMILAAVENGKGAPYRYPVNIRFIK